MDNLNYGVIGNCTSAALISETGTIEWCCLPYFDSTAFFAKILDQDIGGEFAIRVAADYKISQHYMPMTNILVTSFQRGEDQFEIIDFMPRYKRDNGIYHCPPDVIRYIRHKSGSPIIRINYNPRPGYGLHKTRKEIRREYIKVITASGPYESLYLYTDLDYSRVAEGKSIRIEKDCYFLLSYNQKLVELDLDAVHLEYEKTRVYWLSWSSETRRFARYDEAIARSALVLKLLCFQKTGAILAAVTTSLPEEIGSGRNWDYRFCWVRDASMNIALLTALGHYRVAKRFLDFILDVIPYKDEKIQIMYGINGRKNLHEKILPTLQGYENSRPVRIGNEAYKQKQNDIFGVLLDIIYQYLKIFKRSTLENREDLWTVVRTLGRHVERNWMRKDRGIWEFRGWKKHYTFSKLLCWVALDRAMKIARYFSMDSYVRVWDDMRQKIRRDILKKGWDAEIGAFVQAYGEKHLDAANLLMEHYGFIEASDPRYVSTVIETYRQLGQNGLMYRYRNQDDFGSPKSSFTVCTFWMVKSLYRIGRQEEAQNLFDKTLLYRNHLGLLSEDIDFDTKRLLGNFPQGYSHLALIDAAITLAGEDISEPDK
jgi:GH15 family glucan-1,4-alpha-glucosidase